MNRIIPQIIAGTLGYVSTVGDTVTQSVSDVVSNIQPALSNPDNYIKGLVVSGVIQIVMKVIDGWLTKRKAKKAEATK